MNQEQIHFFKNYGYVVIENVFSEEEIKNIRSSFHKQLLDYDVDHEKIINLEIPPPQEIRKKSEVSNIFYSDWKLNTVLDDRIYNLSLSLMQETFMSSVTPGFEHPLKQATTILPYIDRVCYRLPDHIRPEGGLSLHIDHNPTFRYSGKKYRPIQSFIALTDHYGNKCGGLQVVPEFHKISLDYFINTFESEGGEFFHMTSPRFSKLENQIKTINMSKGSVVFWDNRLPHKTCSELCSNDSREVIYFSYMPNVSMNKKYFEQQYQNILDNIAPPSYVKSNDKVDRNWSLDKLNNVYSRLK